ncbi:MAG: sulfatase/phosphatase domain-containing protein, partial [Bryobacteraceae bacterium]
MVPVTTPSGGITYPCSSVRNEWVLSIDNAPTALDLVGLPIPQQMQGKSLLPLLNGKAVPDWRTSMYY